jgi:hypothetical protein
MSLGIDPSEGHSTGLSIYENYPAKVSRISKKEKKGLRQTAKRLFEEQGADAATSFLAGQRGYTNFRPDRLIGKYQSKPIDYNRYRTIGATAFQDLLNRGMTDADWLEATAYAKEMGVRDPSAFQSLITSRITSSPEGQSKIKSQRDIEWESMYGNMPRDAQGNLIRGMVNFDVNKAAGIADAMFGTLRKHFPISTNTSTTTINL